MKKKGNGKEYRYSNTILYVWVHICKSNEDVLFKGHRISVFKIKKVLKIDGGDGFTRIWMYLIALNFTLKKGKFYVMCIWPQ